MMFKYWVSIFLILFWMGLTLGTATNICLEDPACDMSNFEDFHKHFYNGMEDMQFSSIDEITTFEDYIWVMAIIAMLAFTYTAYYTMLYGQSFILGTGFTSMAYLNFLGLSLFGLIILWYLWKPILALGAWIYNLLDEKIKKK